MMAKSKIIINLKNLKKIKMIKEHSFKSKNFEQVFFGKTFLKKLKAKKTEKYVVYLFLLFFFEYCVFLNKNVHLKIYIF